MSKRELWSVQRLWCVFGVCVAIVAGSTSVQGTASAQAEDEFCAGGIVHDYARPLKRLPKGHTLPVFGRLPFGPDWLRVEKYPLSASTMYRDPYFGHVLLSGASKFGYVLREQGSASESVDLGWVVTARMFGMSRSGVLGREIVRKRFRIGRVGRGLWRKLTLNALRRPGLYRFDIGFKDRVGRMLGKFQENLRVVRRRYKARLVVSDSVLYRGESADMRIDNIGTRSITFEEGFSVGFTLQRFDGLGWVEVPLPIVNGWRIESDRIAGFPNLYSGVPAGWSTTCVGSIQIPSEFRAGLYRILKPVKAAKRHGFSPPINLAAEFQVVE
jgi:hypothetical protein